jgi:colanic acid biosynthesis protein WcaH
MQNKARHLQVSKSKYKDLLNYFPVPTVEVLFFNKDLKKVLLFKRNNEPLKGTYFSTGGRVAKNEILLDAAIRKAKEEAGIVVNRKKLFFGGVQDEIHKKSVFPSIGYHCINIYFGYILNGEKIKLDRQHSLAKWFDVSDKKINPYVKNKIKNLIIAYDKIN